jgi:acetyl-CoA carboxylase biotin carboxyl carrier protein
MKTKPSDSSPEAAMTPKIDYEEINRILKLLEERNLAEFELEVEGFKIKLRKNAPAAIAQAAAPQSGALSQAVPPAAAVPAGGEAAERLHFVTSPIVGMFYRAPSPTSPPFVEVGDPVKKKQVLCIVEAMKLMNEIECDVDGVIEEIFVENGKPVEYGQKLFAIAPGA